MMNMIEIYLNPDNVELFQETADAKGDNSEQVGSAEKLLADLQHLNDPSLALKVSVLECYVQMASKNKSKIELALNSLLTLCSTDANREYVPALLAMANAFVLRNEPAKARNQLKRISKMKYDPEFSQDFERSWLMLADIYITVGKYEFAQELCKKTLAINKSSAKSWEMLGQIMEKEQSYKDAAEHYEHVRTHTRTGAHTRMHRLHLLDGSTGMTNARVVADLLSFLSVPMPGLDVHARDESVGRLQAGVQLPEGQALRGGHRRVPQGAGGVPGLPKDQERHPRQSERGAQAIEKHYGRRHHLRHPSPTPPHCAMYPSSFSHKQPIFFTFFCCLRDGLQCASFPPVASFRKERWRLCESS